MTEQLELLSQGILSKAEVRQWYTGETEAQAQAAIQAIQDGVLEQNMEAMMQQIQIQGAQQAATDIDNQATNPVKPNPVKDDGK